MSSEQGTRHGPALDGSREGPGDAAGIDQSAEPVWRYRVPPPASGTGGGESNTGHATPNAAGHGGGIVEAPADSKVNAPGRPLSSHGGATEPIAGGTAGAIEASRNAEAMGGAAGGGNLGEPAGNADGNMSGSAGTDRASSPSRNCVRPLLRAPGRASY